MEVDENGKDDEELESTKAADGEAVDQPVNEVQIAVVRARRLPAVDKSFIGKATSDPQVVSSHHACYLTSPSLNVNASRNPNPDPRHAVCHVF